MAEIIVIRSLLINYGLASRSGCVRVRCEVMLMVVRRMKQIGVRIWGVGSVLGAASLSAALCVVLFATPAFSSEGARVLHIQIPESFDPRQVFIDVGQYGDGLALSRIVPKQGSREFIEVLGSKTKSVKLLIYYPGYRLVMEEIDRDDISAEKPFVPRFAKLPLVKVKMRLAYSSGKPLAHQRVCLRRPLMEQSYFGYCDGSVMGWQAAPDASGVTDNSGCISMQIPLLLDDPAYSKCPETKPSYNIMIPMDGIGWGTLGYYFVPSSIPMQRTYEKPVDMRLVFRGQIVGTVKRSFLTRHGLHVPIGPVARHGGSPGYITLMAYRCGSRTGSGVGLRSDGSFSMSLPAGKYDLSLDILGYKDRAYKAITIERGFVVGEKETRKILLK